MPLQMDRKEWACEYPKLAYNSAAMKTENKDTELSSLGDFTIKCSINKKVIYFVGHNCTITEHIFKYFLLKGKPKIFILGNSSSLCFSDEGNLPNQQIWLQNH